MPSAPRQSRLPLQKPGRKQNIRIILDSAVLLLMLSPLRRRWLSKCLRYRPATPATASDPAVWDPIQYTVAFLAMKLLYHSYVWGSCHSRAIWFLPSTLVPEDLSYQLSI